MTKVVCVGGFFGGCVFNFVVFAENEFSSLGGVVFEWNVIGLGKNKDVTVLRFMTFKDSAYEATWNIKEMEEKNQRGNVALLEGVKTGSAKVITRFVR